MRFCSTRRWIRGGSIAGSAGGWSRRPRPMRRGPDASGFMSTSSRGWRSSTCPDAASRPTGRACWPSETRIDTLSLVIYVDLSRLDANIARYTRRAREAGVALRAHIKGHRVPEITARQVEAGAVGVSVHSAAEAKAHARAGARDVVVAWPWRDPWRWALFADLARTCEVSLHVDDPAVVPGLAAAARTAKVRLGVRIEVENGLHPGGVAPEKVVSLAQAIDAEDALRLE